MCRGLIVNCYDAKVTRALSLREVEPAINKKIYVTRRAD